MSPTDARSTILSKIRALSDVPASEQPDDVKVPRAYLTTDPDPAESRLERFCERVAEYKATVRQVSAADLPAAIAASCAARGVKSLVVPPDLPSEWIPDGVEIRRNLAPGLSNTQIESSDGVLTAAAWGIAQTGTIVLDSGPGQGRRTLTLLPDYHLCVIRADQVVGIVPEAVVRLETAASIPATPSPGSPARPPPPTSSSTASKASTGRGRWRSWWWRITWSDIARSTHGGSMIMTDSPRTELLNTLARLSVAIPEWRLGQMIANLAVIARSTASEAIWDVEDQELLAAVHRSLELCQAQNTPRIDLIG